MPPSRFASAPLLRLLSLLLCSALLWPQLMLFSASTSIAAPTRNISLRARTRATIKPQAPHRAGELLMRFRQDAPESETTALLSAAGARRGRRLRGESGVERIVLSAGQDAQGVAANFRLSPLVEFVEPNFLISADEIIPNDPRHNEQWALRNTGSGGGQYGADIAAGQAWEATTGSPNTVIAVIDSGIDFTHPDLRRNQWRNRAERPNRQDDELNAYTDDLHGWDWINNDGQVRDEQGHGTAIAGIIAAEGGNRIGISGVMWRASLMDLRVLDGKGTGDVASAVEAIDYATAHGAQVINCSWGTEGQSIALLKALRRASSRGILIVCSAGNNGSNLESTPHYPASYELDNLIAVAATDSHDRLASWSNWGITRATVGAPGVELLSTALKGEYRSVSGSSSAAAVVSGVAGLLRTQRPWLSAQRTRDLIVNGVRPVPALDGKVSTNGIVNAAAMLDGLRLLPDEGTRSSEGINGGDNPPGGLNNKGTNSSAPINNIAADATNPAGPGPRPGDGAEATNLPDLNAARRERPVAPRAAAPVPSTQRSRRNSLLPPHGRRVSDTLPARPSRLTENRAHEPAPLNLLAASFTLPIVGSLLGDSQQSISDSPFSIFSSSSAPQSIAQPQTHNSGDRSWSINALPTSAALTEEPTNLALGGTATQSSDYSTPAYAANKAINGSFADLTHTQYEAQPWWQVDLGSAHFIDIIKLWNRTDCCQDRLSNFYIFVSDAPFASTDLTATLNQAGVSSYYTTGAAGASLTKSINRTGRYVRVQLTASDYLSLGEVEIFGAPNLTVGGAASQSSDYSSQDYTANKAVNSSFNDLTHTQYEAQPWWQVDLGSVRQLSTIKLWNRTDCCQARLSNFYIFVSDTPFQSNNVTQTLNQAGVSSYYTTGEAGASLTKSINRTGRYVRVQLTASDYLSLVEVAVFGPTNLGNSSDVEQYVRDFHQRSLAREPNNSEQTYWNNLLRTAYTQGADSMLLAAQEMGRTLFDSAEYAARGRSDYDFVSDLYHAYLRRAPDQTGWNYWTAEVQTQGRENVRNNLAFSTEFATVVGLLLPNGTAGSNPQSLLTARMEPTNRPGGEGVDSVSRNFGWSLPLVLLPGRAGLDLGLSLSYNSSVWTKSGPYIYFDEDNGSPSPGFRLGFPVIQGRLFNAQTAQDAYLMLLPSGSRVELRQVGSSNIYEAVDSSYLQLTETSANALTVTATDGTQLSYSRINMDFRCTQIKDINGNYLTISYNAFGQLATITDTLARVLTVEYDSNQNPTRILQSWAGQAQPHEWATFGYGSQNIQAGFSDVKVVGIQSGTTIPVLNQVGSADGGRFNFTYSSWGQVSQISHYAADNHLLSYTAYTMYAGAQSDCPRVATRADWAENWNLIGGVATAATTSYAIPVAASWTMPNDSSAQSGLMSQVTQPDNTVHKLYYHSTGWARGLPLLSETWGGNLKLRWSTTNWEQANESLGYQLNPRPKEMNIGDSNGNRRRTTITYGPYNLPTEIKEHDGSTETILRRTQTTYLLTPAYTARRIIGLISEVKLYGKDPASGAEQLYSKVDYQYDQGGEFLVNQGTPVQYSAVGYAERGLATSVRRWDVNNPTDVNWAVESRIGYNTTGAPIFSRDPLGNAQRQATISYTDSFSDNNNSRNTLAYPTLMTDPGGNPTTAVYNYNSGAVTRTQNPKGAAQKIDYDAAGRVERVTNLVNNAYTRWVYPTSQNQVQSFATIRDLQTEAYSVSIMDGAGRALATASDLPNSTGGYKGQKTIYDVMGRIEWQTVPQEITSSWAHAGDDWYGWAWTIRQYDWKGRVTRLTNTDGATKEAKYEGCGCAGGEVVITRDEMGRRQKTFFDALGRARKVQQLFTQPKTEALNGNGDAYTTTINVFNARNQVTSSHKYQGAETSDLSCPLVTCQQATFSYDGHGRPSVQHTPEQNSGTTTSYTYNPDDTINTVTDARGAVTGFSYNSRRLVTGITYNNSAGLIETQPVTFDYDAVGNRLWMDDGLGRVDYTYDMLSQLRTETRTFDGVGTYPLTYDYNLAGQLKSLTDSTGVQVGYTYDQVGRLTDVTGSGYANVSSYASNLRYRAWGGLKAATYGSGLSLAVGYDLRLRPSSYNLTGGNPLYGRTGMHSAYQYNADDRLRSTQDFWDNRFDRAFAYDHVGRLQEAYTGPEARDYINGTTGGTPTGPYRQTYQHNVWGEMTNRTTRFWGQGDSFTANYLNGRNQNAQWQYDAAGHVTRDETMEFKYDEAGRNREIKELSTLKVILQDHDGDGQVARRGHGSSSGGYYRYYLRSSVLGGSIITELFQEGHKLKGYVYAGGEVLAEQENNVVLWQHTDPVTGSQGQSQTAGIYGGSVEADPMGVNVGYEDPELNPAPDGFAPDTESPMLGGMGGGGCSGSNPNCRNCYLDGVELGCEQVTSLADRGAAVIAPTRSYLAVTYNGQRMLAFFQAYGDGRQGFVPVTAQYAGDGFFRSSFGAPRLRASSRTVRDTDFQQLNGATGEAQLGYSPDAFAHARRKTRQETVPRQELNDCQQFAALVDQIAKETIGKDFPPADIRNFMDRLATTFTEFPAADALSVRRAQTENIRNQNYQRFGSSGFAPQFFEPDVGRTPSNQVRHAVGGLIAGYVHPLGADRALRRMNERENPADLDHGLPDINLNGQTVPMGGALAVGNREIARNLGDWIRRTLCQ